MLKGVDNSIITPQSGAPPTSPAPAMPSPAPVNNPAPKASKRKSILFVIIALILVAAAAFGAYKWEHNRAVKVENGLETQIDSLNTKVQQLQKAASSSSNSTSSNQTTDTNAGWKSAELTYEKIFYKYPANWTVTVNSAAEPKSKNACTYPGHDLVTLNSPSGTQVVFDAGQDCFGDAVAKAFGSVPINALGQNMYLVFEGDVGPSTPTAPNSACLAPTTNPDSSFAFDSKNIFFNGTGSGSKPVNSFCYIPYNPSKYQNTTAPSFTIAQIKAMPDYGTAKLIFESMHY